MLAAGARVFSQVGCAVAVLPQQVAPKAPNEVRRLDRHSPAVPVKEVGPSGQLGEGCPDVVDKSLRLFEGEEVPPCGGFVEEDDVGVAALELPA